MNVDYIPPIIRGHILVVQSYATGEDFIEDKLLSGKDGELLKGLLKDAGIDLKDCSFCTSWSIVEALTLLNPTYIIALGNEALRATTKKSGIKKHRGTVIELHASFNFTCPVYPTYSIEELKNVPTFRKTMVADLRNIQQGQQEPIMFDYWSEYGKELHAGNLGLVSENEEPTELEGHDQKKKNHPCRGTRRNGENFRCSVHGF